MRHLANKKKHKGQHSGKKVLGATKRVLPELFYCPKDYFVSAYDPMESM